MFLQGAIILTLLTLTPALSHSTQGIQNLVKRRLPQHVDFFTFRLTENQVVPVISLTDVPNDEYNVSKTPAGKVLIEGNSPIALATGLHRYLADVVKVDIWWTIGSQLDKGPPILPLPNSPITGASIVPWRYHFNPVTFSYTTAFWDWHEWELELDWLALRGVNLPLALVGQEKILVEVFRDMGLTEKVINSYLSGPAFQAWNRMGNIQGSWGGNLPTEWIEGQFELQKKITKRMVELGMTPILPCFSGGVPRGFTDVFPGAAVMKNSKWQNFPDEYTNVTILNPLDPLYERMQQSFISKQTKALGNITNFYLLDQFNEQDPASGELGYLKNISHATWKNLKVANPAAIWVMQAWLFSKNPIFWTNDRIKAYLGGVKSEDMLLLDLFAETKPVWERLKDFFGKPWIWCQLHNYGANMGLYGQISTITVNPIEALSKSPSLVGFGLTMEGQQGNEIVYDLLLDQAWSKVPIDTEAYFGGWASRRYYNTKAEAIGTLLSAWDFMHMYIYGNTNKTIECVSKSILELSPSVDGMLGRTGHHPTDISYDLGIMVQSFSLIHGASHAEKDPSLWEQPAYLYDLIDVTRQVLSGLFQADYLELINAWKTNPRKKNLVTTAGERLISRLDSLDLVLSSNSAFSLSTWVNAARSQTHNSTLADFYEYNARLQITGWGPNGEINDYASKSWGGLVRSYYIPRWQIFIQYLKEVHVKKYNDAVLRGRLRDFEKKWQLEKLSDQKPARVSESLRAVLSEEMAEQIYEDWLRTKALARGQEWD